MPRHLIIGPGPCNFEIHKYRLFLESVCVGKQEIGYCKHVRIESNMVEEGGISWPLEEGSETNPNSCFPTHTDSKNSLYLSTSKMHGPGPIIR